MKPSVYSDFNDMEEAIFDTTPCGRHVAAERDDEPGNERSRPGDGDPRNGVAGERALQTARILGGDPEGDWSWKPQRDRLLGKDMGTFRGVPKGAAELYGPRILS